MRFYRLSLFCGTNGGTLAYILYWIVSKINIFSSFYQFPYNFWLLTLLVGNPELTALSERSLGCEGKASLAGIESITGPNWKS